jgi:hypothetical protein
MGLRVISTKLTEEEHSKIIDMCKESETILSAFLKQCIMELVEKEENKIEKPIEATPTPGFSLINEKIAPIENKVTAPIRYQYF